MKIVECVPNFSEGRRREVIDSINRAAKDVVGVTVLDCESDPNHNRMVLTFVGSPEAVKDAALASSGEAVRQIDLRIHRGEHPRMGAVDVVPFVPIREVTMEDCVLLAREFGLEFAKRFDVPVFLYESAATRPERKDLAKVREGQFEGLSELIGSDPSRNPDYGPSHIHPSAGATAVGARPILIAYNVNLDSKDITVAKRIARLVRGRDGGLPTVKALGFDLKDRSLVQVSMNLTDYTVSSISRAFDAVSKNAEALGVGVVESEIVGLVPMDAMVEAGISYLKLTNFVSNQIIENRLFAFADDIVEKGTKEVSSGDKEKRFVDYRKMTLGDLSSSVASMDPVPGGGTVSAFAGSLAASLVSMVCRLTIGKKGYESSSPTASRTLTIAEEARVRLLELGVSDSAAFGKVSKALSLPKSTDLERAERKKALGAALREATEVPIETLLECAKVWRACEQALVFGNKRARSDAQTALELSKAAASGALANVRTNLESLASTDPIFVAEKNSTIEPLVKELNL